MKRLLALTTSALVLALSACSEPAKEKQHAVEKAGREVGQAAAKEMHIAIDNAKEVQHQLNEHAEALDENIEEQTDGEQP